ncbi:MAG: prepilin-type N-terminal cleavage/methylation domain-containing protein [Gemmatimonadota bacterium]
MRVRSTYANEGGFGLVEAMVAIIILAVGLVSVAGISFGTMSLIQTSSDMTDQTMAGHLALESVQRGGYAAAVSGTDTVTINYQDYPVALTVTNVSATMKQVTAVVSGSGSASMRTFITRIGEERPTPDEPAEY